MPAGAPPRQRQQQQLPRVARGGGGGGRSSSRRGGSRGRLGGRARCGSREGKQTGRRKKDVAAGGLRMWRWRPWRTSGTSGGVSSGASGGRCSTARHAAPFCCLSSACASSAWAFGRTCTWMSATGEPSALRSAGVFPPPHPRVCVLLGGRAVHNLNAITELGVLVDSFPHAHSVLQPAELAFSRLLA